MDPPYKCIWFGFNRRENLGFVEMSIGLGCSLQAYEVCTKRGLTKERVFILGRMGNSRKALALIVNELQDMQQVQKLQLSETVSNKMSSKTLKLFTFL